MVAVLDTKKAGGTQLSVEEATVWLTPKRFLRRALAAYMLHRHYSVAQARKFLSEAQECAKEAHLQGTILNPRVLEDKLRERKPIIVSTAGLELPISARKDPLYEQYVNELKRYENRTDLKPEEVLLKGDEVL